MIDNDIQINERDKEFDSLLEDRHSQTLRIAKNLAQIVQANKRQEAKTVREIVLYYFDYFFGELCFWEGWVPVIKLGAIPHFILVFSVYLSLKNEKHLLFLCLLMYLICMVLIILMRLLLRSINRYFSSK